MKSTRLNWAVVAIVALVLLNIGLMATVWLQKTGTKIAGTTESRIAPPQNGRGALVQDLQFDSVQAMRFDSLRQQHFTIMKGLNEQMRKLKDRLFEGLKTPGVSGDSITGAIGQQQAKIDLQTYEHFKQVRLLCNDKQKERFDHLIKDITRRLAPPPPPRKPDDPKNPQGAPGVNHPNRPPPPDGPDGDEPPPPDRRE